MEMIVLGIVSLASVAMSFAFSCFVVKACRAELVERSAPDEKRSHHGNPIGAAAERVLGEVSRVFVIGGANGSGSPGPNAHPVHDPAPEASSAPRLPRRHGTPHSPPAPDHDANEDGDDEAFFAACWTGLDAAHETSVSGTSGTGVHA